MTTFKLIGAIALVSVAAATVTPALADPPVIGDPGVFAFFYPSGDLGIGTSRPADAMAALPRGSMAQLRMAAPHAMHRHHGMR